MLTEVHPDRISACFGSGVADSLIAILRREPRFAERLQALLAVRYRLGEAAADEMSGADATIAALDRQALDRLTFRAGAVLHAGTFVREIRGPVLAGYGERFGQDALSDARRHRDLAIERPSHADPDALEAGIAADGQACLGAWIEALPAAIARGQRLRWPSDAEVPVAGDPQIARNGPQIMRRLVEEHRGA